MYRSLVWAVLAASFVGPEAYLKAQQSPSSTAVSLCRATAPVADSLLRKAEAACAEALERLEIALAITPEPAEFVIVVAGREREEGEASPSSWVVRVPSFERLPQFIDAGLIGHEVAHAVVFEWLHRVTSRPLGADGLYATMLPDVLDDGLAILGEPEDARQGRRSHLARIDVPTFEAVLRMAHPRGADPTPLAFPVSARRTFRPCPECPSPPFHPEKWVLITEWRAEPGGEVIEGDTTYWTERPPEREVAERTRFYTLSEAAIGFLQDALEEPEELRDYVLSLMEDAPAEPDPMAVLSERIGESSGVIEERWRRWIAEQQAAARPEPRASNRAGASAVHSIERWGSDDRAIHHLSGTSWR